MARDGRLQGGRGHRGGPQGGRGRGGGQPNGGRGGGQQGYDNNKFCKHCNKAGHNTQDCFHKPNGAKGGQQQQGNSGGKFCTHCSMKGHNTEDCRKKNGAQSQALTQPQSPNQIQAYGTTCQTSQVPEYNGVPIQFNEPCQLCGLTGHSARECSTCNGFVAPQAGKYFPQTYPAPGAIQALYQSPQAQWQQQQQQLCQGYPSSSCELIGEEISMRPLYPPSVQYVPEPNRGGYHQYFEYSRPEIACERLKMRDSDGDFIMGNSWECGDCLIPGRDDDGWERWSCATCPHQPLAQIGWAGYC